jgi:hypothetical protein
MSHTQNLLQRQHKQYSSMFTVVFLQLFSKLQVFLLENRHDVGFSTLWTMDGECVRRQSYFDESLLIHAIISNPTFEWKVELCSSLAMACWSVNQLILWDYLTFHLISLNTYNTTGKVDLFTRILFI